MKIHHLGIVAKKKDIKKFQFKFKKIFSYKDKFQNNRLFIGYCNQRKIWIEFVVPLNRKSTVYNFLRRKGISIHHFAFYTKNLERIKNRLLKKKGYIFVGSFKVNITCFGGKLNTMFFYKNGYFIEFLSKR